MIYVLQKKDFCVVQYFINIIYLPTILQFDKIKFNLILSVRCLGYKF